MPTDDHTPLGHARRYVSSCYAGMRDDEARTLAYERAIAEAARGRVVVDIGTGALALLAIFAAEAGAKHVYAIEVQPAAAAAARESVLAAGLSDRITVLEGFSTAIALPEAARATLLVHELIGEVAGEEGVVAAISDAARRFLDPSAQPPFSIPSRSRSLLAPCEYPDAAYCARFPPETLEAPGGGRALKLPSLPRSCLLAPAQPFEDLRFESGAPSGTQRAALTFEIARAGALRGLACHVELHCSAAGGDAPPDVSSAWEGSHWRNVLLLLPAAQAVSAGQLVRVQTSAELGGPQPQYTFDVSLQEPVGGTGAGQWRVLDVALCYPEAALNCNDMADLMMDGS